MRGTGGTFLAYFHDSPEAIRDLLDDLTRRSYSILSVPDGLSEKGTLVRP
jgi:hypothetical protein